MARANFGGDCSGALRYCDRCGKSTDMRYAVRVGEVRMKVCLTCRNIIDEEKSARADVKTPEAA